ncbi:uncharacterized protein LOC130046743 [Ostrea edulis]|uniref:uncharacterized protein LOC130046743 n=1 Tax=Ostrea edulis TaxID=37623 RepID=UPI0024AF9A90|nr:uncharacterized protein LOC130046743 [Ostrea edulis]
MARIMSLKDIPDDFSASYMLHTPSLRQKQRTVAFMKDSYVKSVRLYTQERENMLIKAEVYRSQRKTQDPLKINIDVNFERKKLDDAHCSCKAGNSVHFTNVCVSSYLLTKGCTFQAPLILPITKPRAAENCGSTVFPKALHTCVDLECEWTELNLTQSDAINLENQQDLKV